MIVHLILIVSRCVFGHKIKMTNSIGQDILEQHHHQVPDQMAIIHPEKV